MISTLYSIYSFITDVPEYIDIVAVFLVVGVASMAFNKAETKTENKVLHWLAGICTLPIGLALCYALWYFTGLPHWVGWFVPHA
jgi:hypothetical protein